MQKTYSEVAQYYNKLWTDPKNKELLTINSRHRHIVKRLKKIGLKNNYSVLEIGCGIGTLTGFIAKQIPDGKIVAVDISNETIDVARYRFRNNKNIEFVVSDMTNFSYDKKFDLVVLPDVLEHIPKEAHSNIFKTIRKIIKEGGLVFINIPAPRALEWHHKHSPELLQIIDQPLHTDQLLNSIYPNDFYLESLETYSVFYNESDYQALVFKPNKEIEKMEKLSKIKVFINSLSLRIFG